jgi:hypothetical protein
VPPGNLTNSIAKLHATEALGVQYTQNPAAHLLPVPVVVLDGDAGVGPVVGQQHALHLGNAAGNMLQVEMETRRPRHKVLEQYVV